MTRRSRKGPSGRNGKASSSETLPGHAPDDYPGDHVLLDGGAGRTTSAPPAEPNLTDRGNGIRLARWHGHDLRHVHVWKKWLVWDDSRWRLDDTGEIVRWAKAVATRMYVEAVEAMAGLGPDEEVIDDDDDE